MDRDRDAHAIFAVRFLLLIVVLSVSTAFVVAGIEKVVAPGHDAGQVALTVAWPAGSALALLLRWRWRRRRAQ